MRELRSQLTAYLKKYLLFLIMTLHDRYTAGQTIEVYDEIATLGRKAFEPEYYNQVEAVLVETFGRVRHNLQVIYQALQSINYQFKTTCQYNFEKPLHPPLDDTENLLNKLDGEVRPFGFVPQSLKYFYGYVGGVNFVWDYEVNDDILWPMADPLQVASLDALVESVTDENWREVMDDYMQEDGTTFLELAADVYHKDNVSGGPAYSLLITEEPAVDSVFINEPHETTFINYLRVCFDYGGFPGLAAGDYPDDYEAFLEKVKPQLKKI